MLFVDDEEALVELLSLSLEALGYRVTGFTDPEAALTEFRAQPLEFDAVVSDLSMPRMSGLALARKLREIRPDVPVVLMSGYLRSADEAAAKEIGVLGFAFKGSAVDEIAKSLDDILRGRRGPGGANFDEPT